MRKLMGVLLAVAMLITASTSLAEMTPGTYTAEATGNNGPVSVAVTVDEQAILSVEVTGHSETPGHLRYPD